jgi:hypothetical protein
MKARTITKETVEINDNAGFNGRHAWFLRLRDPQRDASQQFHEKP